MADRPESGNDRLTSWKEIAAYLGRGVRTVQRWEHELGLPVLRLEGKKRDIVHALPEELDAWLEEYSHQLEPDNHTGHPSGSNVQPSGSNVQPSGPNVQPSGSNVQPSGPRHWVGWGRNLTFFAIALALLWGGWHGWWWLTATPADYRVEGHNLIVVDESGRELWRHTFDFPLSENDYKLARSPDFTPNGKKLAALRDLNGDGRPELLFGVIPSGEHYSERALLCFDHKGQILWRFQPDRTVHYGDHHRPGDHHFEPPYAFGALYLFPGDMNTPDAVWATFSRSPWFPTVVAKLNAEGDLLGEYWYAGAIGELAEATLATPLAGLAGRRVLLAGAYSNESNSPALSVLDYDNPTGFSPAENPSYLCQNCPPGPPLAYVRFPRSELGRESEAYEGVEEIRRFGDNTIQIITRISYESAEDLNVTGYYFDQNFRLVDSTIGSGYATLHNRLTSEGLLDHELNLEKEQAELSTPLYWNGEKFTREWPGFRPQRISVSSEPSRPADR